MSSLQISVVGSRSPSPDGKRNARDFAYKLTRLGITITSGLASGLDSCAHRGAMEQGREVFAIPRSIHNSLTQGCHGLIGQGAKLVENTGDIVEEIVHFVNRQGNVPTNRQGSANSKKVLDENTKLLLDNIGSYPVSVDFLVEETKLAVNLIANGLISMELEGLIETLPSGKYIRI